MSIPRRIIGLLALTLVLGALPASGQSGKQETKKEPAPTTSTSVRVSRPARVRIGGFVFGAGYSRFSGAFPYYSYFPYAYYRPWFHDAFYPYYYGAYPSLWYHPGWYTSFAYREGLGEVKLRSNLENANVFLDDGFAGKTKELKTIWLEPGAYNLRVEAENHAPFALRIYVLGGKALKIDAKLLPNQER
jgi:hypothetical protein